MQENLIYFKAQTSSSDLSKSRAILWKCLRESKEHEWKKELEEKKATLMFACGRTWTACAVGT